MPSPAKLEGMCSMGDHFLQEKAGIGPQGNVSMRLSAHDCPPLDTGPKPPQSRFTSECPQVSFPPHSGLNYWANRFLGWLRTKFVPLWLLCIEAMKPVKGQEDQGFFDSWPIMGSRNTWCMKINIMTRGPGMPAALWTIIMIIYMRIQLRTDSYSESRTAMTLTGFRRQWRTMKRDEQLQAKN